MFESNLICAEEWFKLALHNYVNSMEELEREEE